MVGKAITTRLGWRADGSPAYQAQPISDMHDTFGGHGYLVYWYPDQRHIDANPPEDHCPFSNTPWPGAQPYPLVCALDLMPKAGQDARSLTAIARRIIADKRAGKAPWIKYMNWTDESGACWHTSWQPDERTVSSSDTGHVHISIRTDYATSYAARGYDPTTPSVPSVPLEDEMPEKFLAKADDGQIYVCDYKDSVACDAAEADTIAYMSVSGGPALAHGSNAAEWSPYAHGTFIRNGWVPAFGKLPQAVTLTDAQVKAIADQVIAGLPATSITYDDIVKGVKQALAEGSGITAPA